VDVKNKGSNNMISFIALAAGLAIGSIALITEK